MVVIDIPAEAGIEIAGISMFDAPSSFVDNQCVRVVLVAVSSKWLSTAMVWSFGSCRGSGAVGEGQGVATTPPDYLAVMCAM
ncbi:MULTISPECIES: hypothetical protein [unclassified Rhodococcus (in: high G+C Gram-positive bacteria)]|uniref:hypothetical protein n=1 Tax=unclassified Rhodococcus (in: high G+C Gram-positive bacteria) TaxID=192944 RepID=UPI00163AB711|nr:MULTISPECIES: hypothetical protein [unclassified Rhodococcus (in: high G+C Gram-positive bacteria)]MBC2637504.1 hypothetical protein [Rhodococcus sp. 3A]MBC2898404.1 hypothetical protein [Rhodococcus sp. 4CII]